MRITFIIFLMALVNNLSAQKKISFDLNVSVLQSVGKDIQARYHSDVNPLTVYYLSRRRFKHPYFNVLGHVNYLLNQRIGIGLQSGFYLHYLEKYFSNVERTTLSVPVMVTFSYKLFDIHSGQLGINVSAGMLFHNIDEFMFKIKNGTVCNIAVFYTLNSRSTLKLGMEKQLDNVTFIPDEREFKKEAYKYHLKRLSVALSYGYRFGK